MKINKKIKLIVSIFLGLLITVFSFIAFIVIAISSTIREKLCILLVIFYIALILIIIFWNMKKTKVQLILLCILPVCVIIGIIFIKHDNYVQSIPIFQEPDKRNEHYYLYEYEPFREYSLLAKPDKEPSIKMTDNLPVLDGATALYPVYAAFVNAVYPNGNYGRPGENGILFCSKTDGAYDNLLNGEVDIIFCAGPSDEQMRQFNEKGIELKLVPIGREAFVFFVNKENIVNNLSIENIRGIYSGNIKNWKKLGGDNERILAFQRTKNSGSQTALEYIMGGNKIAKARRENVPSGMLGIINEVADYRNFGNAIGYSFLFFSTKMIKNDQIKLLSINGIYPLRETIQNGTYPFSNSFYAIYNSENKSENIKIFIEWILSEEGQNLIEKTGYISIK